ncbi:MAG: glucosaminidase domain-containing protein [Treponema sp.]|jgi:hypothetical protein|nr:glucosaminidase domain-containing protein [Treponema sp.]
MKHKVLILTFFMCFAASTVFAGPRQDMNVENMNVEKMNVENMQSDGQSTSGDINITAPTVTITAPTVTINAENVIGGQGDNKPDPVPTQTVTDRLPVTWEIVNLVRDSGTNNFGELDFYLSKSFTMKIDERAKDVIVNVNDRSLLIGDQNPSERTIEFKISEKGKYIDFSESRAEFVILFQISGEEENFQLHFERDAQRDCFTLVSVSVDGKPYGIRVDGELPRLEIGGRDNRNTEIRVVPAAAGDQGGAPSGGNYSVVQVHQEHYADNTYWGHPSREIMGAGSVTKEAVIQYIGSRNSSPALNSRDIGLLIDIYFQEARNEGINRDIAIAQMLYATDFLRNRMATRNYAGFIIDGSRLNGRPWNGRFDDMRTGVKAHIQHLKGYVSRERPSGQIVDPRYQILVDLGYLGSVRTFDQLCRRWSENPEYGNRINRILSDLYNY